MRFVFDVPEVGEGVVEVELASWKAAPGERIVRDQPLCELTTDKATLEISSPVDGVLTERFVAEGAMAKIGSPLCAFDTGAQAAAPEPLTEAQSAPAASSAPSGGTTKATPAVRRHARELGIDVHTVAGTGPGGRVTHDDLTHNAPLAPLRAAAPTSAAPASPSPAASGSSQKRIPIRGVRRTISDRMRAAKQTAAHFTYVEEIDCTALVSARDVLKQVAAAQGIKLTYLPFFAKACSVAFRDFPEINATMDEVASELVVDSAHHIGFACDTPSGLMVPVVRDCQTKTILQIAREMEDLFTRAKIGKCSRSELSGSTFTITGVGNIGGILATPILNIPEVAILGINQIKKRPVVLENDTIAVRSMTYLSPSFDHRVIDGAVAARFTARLKVLLEQPERLLLELA